MILDKITVIMDVSGNKNIKSKDTAITTSGNSVSANSTSKTIIPDETLVTTDLNKVAINLDGLIEVEINDAL